MMRLQPSLKWAFRITCPLSTKYSGELTGNQTEMRAHHVLSETLSSPPSTPSDETTSSLQHTLLSLRQTSRARAESHRALANDLANSVWLAFSQWKDRHKDRIKGSKEELMGKEGVVTAWEKEVKRLAVVSGSDEIFEEIR